MSWIKYLQNGTKESNMRLNVTIGVVSLSLILFAVSVRIIFDVLRDKETSWWDMGLFVVSVCTGITMILYQKVQQKKLEITKEPMKSAEDCIPAAEVKPNNNTE
jgi:NhaP-type Na+/H+ or K+/H+ antiporter